MNMIKKNQKVEEMLDKHSLHLPKLVP